MHISEIVISALKIQPQQHIIPLQKSPTLQSQRKRILNRCVNRELIKMFCLSHQQQQLTSSDPEMFNHQIHILKDISICKEYFMFYFQLTYELTWITDLIKTSLTWNHPQGILYTCIHCKYHRVVNVLLMETIHIAVALNFGFFSVPRSALELIQPSRHFDN